MIACEGRKPLRLGTLFGSHDLCANGLWSGRRTPPQRFEKTFKGLFKRAIFALRRRARGVDSVCNVLVNDLGLEKRHGLEKGGGDGEGELHREQYLEIISIF